MWKTLWTAQRWPSPLQKKAVLPAGLLLTLLLLQDPPLLQIHPPLLLLQHPPSLQIHPPMLTGLFLRRALLLVPLLSLPLLLRLPMHPLPLQLHPLIPIWLFLQWPPTLLVVLLLVLVLAAFAAWLSATLLKLAGTLLRTLQTLPAMS